MDYKHSSEGTSLTMFSSLPSSICHVKVAQGMTKQNSNIMSVSPPTPPHPHRDVKKGGCVNPKISSANSFTGRCTIYQVNSKSRVTSQRTQKWALVPVSRKSQKLFGPVKPFLMICISKRKQCIGIKLCVEVNFVRIKIVWKEQLCKHKA